MLFVSPHILLVAPEPYYIWRVRLCWRVQPGRGGGPSPQLPMLHVHWQYAEGKTLQTVLRYLPQFPWMGMSNTDSGTPAVCCTSKPLLIAGFLFFCLMAVGTAAAVGKISFISHVQLSSCMSAQRNKHASACRCMLIDVWKSVSVILDRQHGHPHRMAVGFAGPVV